MSSGFWWGVAGGWPPKWEIGDLDVGCWGVGVVVFRGVVLLGGGLTGLGPLLDRFGLGAGVMASVTDLSGGVFKDWSRSAADGSVLELLSDLG